MIYAQFWQRAVYPVGTDNLIKGTGDRSIIVIDGREKHETHCDIAYAECLRRGYVGYSLHRGESFTRSKEVQSMVRVFRYRVASGRNSPTGADTAQQAGDIAARMIDGGADVAYSSDELPGVAFPYVVYRRDGATGGIVGTQCATMAQALEMVSA